MPGIKLKEKELVLLIRCLRPSLVLFRRNDPLRMAGATAFFSTFALPPIVFILAQLFGLFIGQRNMGQGLIKNISNTLGEDGADQVRLVIRSIRGFNDSWFMVVVGFVFLFFVATTLFNVIKNSMNQLWQISIQERPGLLFKVSIRLRSFAVILLVGILFFADLLFESFDIIAGNYLETIFQGVGVYFKSIMSKIGSVIIVAAWFSMLFHFLADGRPVWKASMIGGFLTGILFTAGRYLLRILLVDSNIGNIYGAAGSFVLILLFVFYSSFILYYGASFIAVYSLKKQWPIRPNDKAFSNKVKKM
ncbi:MAG: YihY/virulence factor BrkB family protein [Chitinophagaceae bacterium]|nr:YihY/virulence factor BrkB family protein [Chitinophagaceae bacterium]